MEPYFLLSLSVIGALVLVGIGVLRASLTGLRKDVSAMSDAFGAVRVNQARIEAVVWGANGDNGINGDVRQLKEWRQDVEEQALPRRVAEIERRTGPDDRRGAA